MKKILILLSISAFSGIVFSQHPYSPPDTIFAMDLEELMNTKVTIATKSEQPLNESPSTISVITSEDIKNMGARQLEDILQTIPGFEITMVLNSYYSAGIRGVRDGRQTSKLLVMIDGTPVNQLFYGCAIYFGYDFNIDNIERIEIIRGPGSALYGRNAFSGVINIITRKNHPGNNLMVKGTLGTFNTRMASAYYGYSKNKFDVSIAAKKVFTEFSDEEFNGKKYDLNRNTLALNAIIKYGSFTLAGNFYDLRYMVLNSYITHIPGFYSLTYANDLNAKVSVMTKLYGHNARYAEDIEQLAPGIAPSYPLGLYFNPQFKEYIYGIESNWNIRFNEFNDLLVGLQADLHGVYDVIIKSNADSISTRPVAIPGHGRDDLVLYEPGWFKNNGHTYQNIAFLAQDIWRPMNKLSITIGARFDFNSQIGSQINPRLGIVYEPVKNSSIKVLYGRAYRAPGPREQYATFGFAYGNENLKPEVINTFELAGVYRFKNFSNALNLYWNNLNDLIYAPIGTEINPDFMYHNIGKNVSKGIEYESKLVLGKRFQSFLNASYTISENTVILNGTDSVYNHPDVAPFKLNVGISYQFYKHFFWNLNMFYRSKMEKFYAPDPNTGNSIEVLDPIGNYAIFNSTLRINDLIQNIDISASLYNILDTKYYSQDNQHLHQPSQPGRQILFNFTYAF
jgi:outer membrane receptor protein involved in Fe transport